MDGLGGGFSCKLLTTTTTTNYQHTLALSPHPPRPPRRATMLSVITCDAPVTPEVWRGMFKRGSINSFNQITVDGDTSTNDTVIGLASGLEGGAGGWARCLACLAILVWLVQSSNVVRAAGNQCSGFPSAAAAVISDPASPEAQKLEAALTALLQARGQGVQRVC